MNHDQLVASLPITGDLELDLTRHVDYYYEVVRSHAQAGDEVEARAYDLAYTKAAIVEGLRREALANGVKMTVGDTEAAVEQDTLYVAAHELWRAAKRELSKCLALKMSYEARRYCLGDLVQLQTRGMSAAGITQYADTKTQMAEKRKATEAQRRLR